MTYAESVLKLALTDPAKRPAPPIEKKLDIRIGKKGGHSAQDVLNLLPGGWLIDVAAFPETRPVIEQWIADSMEKAFRLRSADDAESKRWYAVANELTGVCMYCNRAYFARLDAVNGKAAPERESLWLQAALRYAKARAASD